MIIINHMFHTQQKGEAKMNDSHKKNTIELINAIIEKLENAHEHDTKLNPLSLYTLIKKVESNIINHA